MPKMTNNIPSAVDFIEEYANSLSEINLPIIKLIEKNNVIESFIVTDENNEVKVDKLLNNRNVFNIVKNYLRYCGLYDELSLFEEYENYRDIPNYITYHEYFFDIFSRVYSDNIYHFLSREYSFLCNFDYLFSESLISNDILTNNVPIIHVSPEILEIVLGMLDDISEYSTRLDHNKLPLYDVVFFFDNSWITHDFGTIQYIYFGTSYMTNNDFCYNIWIKGSEGSTVIDIENYHRIEYSDSDLKFIKIVTTLLSYLSRYQPKELILETSGNKHEKKGTNQPLNPRMLSLETGKKYLSESEGNGSPKTPHWRKGYWREQLCGSGENKYKKKVWIQPSYVNKDKDSE